MVVRRLVLVLAVLMFCRVGLGDEPLRLDGALAHIPADAHALVLVDARLYELISPELSAYVQAAEARRKFTITVLPLVGLDDCRPPQVREAMQKWHAERPKVEGVLFVGNVKLPSFFMPRGDTLSVRLWSKYYEDLEMVPTREMRTGSTPSFAPKGFKVPEHDFDQMLHCSTSPALWAAFLPVGYQDEAKNTYKNWAEQLAPFFKKTAGFYSGTVAYGRGMYLLSNDGSLLVRAKPVWDAIGPKEIEFYSINEKGLGAYKNNPAGYKRVHLEKYPSLEAFEAYCSKHTYWMEEGWQSPAIFLKHMAEGRRRIVWWNVHSNPEISMITTAQAHDMTGGGLIALLSGCSVGGFKQPGSHSFVDTRTSVEKNVLSQVVYGHSDFVVAIGSVHNRVEDECATPLMASLYSGGYLGMAHLMRLRQQAKDTGGNAGALRQRQEIMIGDPFADTN
ncbi:MAG: hypothetical protein ACLQLG_16450 [Thermoguttaceae bacterium]